VNLMPLKPPQFLPPQNRRTDNMGEMHFYASHLPTCDVCNKPATAQILGPGNASYGHTCPRHEKQRIAHLTKVHNERRESYLRHSGNSVSGEPENTGTPQ
jgi:hypothetical protein